MLLAIQESGFQITEVISGGAIGVDAFARRWARENSVRYTEFLPDWNKYGKSAGFKRNVLIVNAAEQLIAVWDGFSRGTHHSVELARTRNIPVFIYYPKGLK